LTKLGKNGWRIDSTPGKAVFTRRQPGGWQQRKEVSGVVFRSHFHGGVPEPSHAAEVGPSDVTRLDTVQQIHERSDDDGGKWKTERDLADREFTLQVEKEARSRGYDDLADRLKTCGIIRGRKVCLKCKNKGEFEKWDCGHYFLCARCARIRAKKRRKDLRRSVAEYRPEPGCRWKLLTVTLGTGGQHKEALQKISAHFGELWREVLTRKWQQIDGEPVERNGKLYVGKYRVFIDEHGALWRRVGKVQGAGFRSSEFGPLTGNIHAHAMVCIPWIPKGVIIEEWKRLTGSYIIDIQAIKAKPGAGETALADAITEVTKYVTKIGNVAVSVLVDFWEALRGRQVTQIYGGLRGIAKEDAEIDFSCSCGCSKYRWEYVRREDANSYYQRGPPCK
jgi:hypothetical protein